MTGYSTSILLFSILLQSLPAIGMVVFDKQGQFEPLHVSSPIFNKNVGRQIFDCIEGPIVYTRNFKLCDLPEADLVALARGKVVLIDRFDGQFWDMGAGRNHADCLARVGARAAIKAYHDIGAPGMGARAHTAPTIDPERSIPLLHIKFEDIPKALVERIKLGDDSIIANMTADPNEWEDMWSSPYFFAIWEIVLPFLNFVGVMIGLAACGTLVIHFRFTSRQKVKLSPLKRKMRNANMRLLMISNVILTCTCFIRQYYCLSGPLYSSTVKSMDFHLILLDVTIAWESTASIAAIMIFQFWASFGMPRGERKLHNVLGALAIIAFPLYLALTIVYAERATRVGIITLVIKPALLATITGIVAVTYVHRVVQFLRQTMSSTSRANQKQRRHIGTFMSIASATNVLAFFAVVVGELSMAGLTVQGRFASYTVLFFSLTIQGISQMVAFFPSLSVLQTEGRVVHEQCALARELRQKRHFNTKHSRESSEVQPRLTVDHAMGADWNDDSAPLSATMRTLAESPSDMPRHETKELDDGNHSAQEDDLEAGASNHRAKSPGDRLEAVAESWRV